MLDKNDKNIKWFEEARLGLFIHWGIYSATEGFYNGKETGRLGEWIQATEEIPNVEYEKYTKKLNTDGFDAEKIAELAKNAGMKYMVFTAKHHEGFAMYDTKYDDYSIIKRCNTNTDPMGELAREMRKRDIVPCVYYSQALDFHEENATGNTWDFKTPEDERDFISYLNGKSKFQIKELLTNYGDINMIWFDVARGMTTAHAEDLRKFVKDINPACLINERICWYGDYHDFACMGDNETPLCKKDYCAETCATMNDSWGYKKADKNFKSSKEIIELLCSLVSKGVNLLLNIGPRPDGSIPCESIEILENLGKWMSVNSEAVYKTKASPYVTDFSFGWVAQKDNHLYIYIKEPRKNVTLFALQNTVVSAESMEGEKVTVTNIKNGINIDLSDVSFGDTVKVIKLKLDGKPVVSQKLFQQEASKVTIPAFCAEIVEAEYDGKEAETFVDNTKGETYQVYSKIKITDSGKIASWTSEHSFVKWKVNVLEEGEYDVILYTGTRKYEPWVGGHIVRIVMGEQEIRNVLKEDRIPDGVDRKYFSETGSEIGKLRFEKPGEYEIYLYADKINQADKAGLSVTKLILDKC